MKKQYTSCTILIAILLNGINAKALEITINKNQSKKITAAFDACKNGEVDKLMKLIRSGLNINAKNNLEESLIHIASKQDNIELLKLLVDNGGNINDTDRFFGESGMKT